MSKKDEKAFPITAGQQVYSTGMDLRDWFAGQALQGLISKYGGTGYQNASKHSEDAYLIADYMMNERKKRKTDE